MPSKHMLILHDSADSSDSGRELLKSNIAKHFGVDDQAVSEMVSSLPVVLERGLDLADAQSYKTLFESFGAVVEIIEDSDEIPSPTQTASENPQELEFALGEPAQTESSEKKPEQPKQPLQTAAPASSSDFEFVLDDSAPTADAVKKEIKDEAKAQPVQVLPMSEFSFDDTTPESKPSVESKPSLVEESMPEMGIALDDVIAAPASDMAKVLEGTRNQPEAEQEQIKTPNEQELVSEPIIFTSSPRREKRRTNLVFGVLVVVLIGLSVFIVLSRAKDKDDSSVAIDSSTISKLLAQQKKIAGESSSQSSAALAAPVVPTERWEAVLSSGSFVANMALLSDSQSLAEVEFLVKVSGARQATNEELASGILTIPYLEKFVITTPRLFEAIKQNPPISEFEVSLPGRAYIKDGYKAQIVFGTLKLRASYEPSKDLISGSWELNSSVVDGAKNDSPTGVSFSKEKGYAVLFRGDFSAAKVIPK